MGGRGWISECLAQQNAFVIGRGLRDRIRPQDISLDHLRLSLAVVMDSALEKITKLGFLTVGIKAGLFSDNRKGSRVWDAKEGDRIMFRKSV